MRLSDYASCFLADQPLRVRGDPRRAGQQGRLAVIEPLERTAEAIDLRKSGATFAMIGDRLGVSAQSAHEMVMKGLKATLAEPAAELPFVNMRLSPSASSSLAIQNAQSRSLLV
jgi:hypothetical protein